MKYNSVIFNTIFYCKNILFFSMRFNALIWQLSFPQVLDSDGFPQIICVRCKENAVMSYSFKIQCENSQKYFENSGPTIKTEKDPLDDKIVTTWTKNVNNITSIQLPTIQAPPLPIQLNQDKVIPTKMVLLFCTPTQKVVKNKITSNHTFSNTDIDIKPNLAISDVANTNKNHSKNTDKKTNEVSGLFCTKAVTPKEDHVTTNYDSEEYVCDVCGALYNRKMNFKIHYRTHTGEKPYKCRTCDRRFHDYTCRKSHELSHSGIRDYVCEICGQAFARSVSLSAHKEIHNTSKNYECQVCQKKFQTKVYLRNHMRFHRNRKYQCDVCEKFFFTSTSVKMHKRMHTGEKPYVCKICDKGFTQGIGLRRHIEKAH